MALDFDRLGRCFNTRWSHVLLGLCITPAFEMFLLIRVSIPDSVQVPNDVYFGFNLLFGN